MKAIIFTDLDASLLHEETFSCFEIIDTLKSFMSNGVLIVPNTSKTEIETRNVLESLGIRTPFIVENGAKFCDIHHSFQLIAETEKDVVERYKVMKATIQEGYAYSVTGDVTIKRQSDDSYLLCADFTRFNKQKEVLFEGRAEYQWINVPDKGWKMNYLKGIDRGSNLVCMLDG